MNEEVPTPVLCDQQPLIFDINNPMVPSNLTQLLPFTFSPTAVQNVDIEMPPYENIIQVPRSPLQASSVLDPNSQEVLADVRSNPQFEEIEKPGVQHDSVSSVSTSPDNRQLSPRSMELMKEEQPKSDAQSSPRTDAIVKEEAILEGPTVSIEACLSDEFHFEILVESKQEQPTQDEVLQPSLQCFYVTF